MDFDFARGTKCLMFILLFLAFSSFLQAQEAALKSIQAIYNRPDQAKIRLKVGGQSSTLLIDLSRLNLERTPDKKSFLDLVAANKVAALQPARFKREESATSIHLASRNPLPDQFQIGEVTYYKSQVNLGLLDDKELTTEVYLTSGEDQTLRADLNLNFNWSTLKINKSCPKPVCQEWKIKDGKAVCKRVKCN